MSPNAMSLLRQLRRTPRPYRSRWWKHVRSGALGLFPPSYAWAIDLMGYDKRAQDAVEGRS